MPIHLWAELTWEELDALDRDRLIAILPVGATEAHGPHLPLGTDVIIAQAMARAGAERLCARGWIALLLPPVCYSVAEYGADFAGTITLSAAHATALLVDIARSLARHRVRALAVANAHLEPAHIQTLTTAIEAIEGDDLLRGVFPDVTQKPWALRLSAEFKSGACHAGSYEGSIVLAERPELVREEIRLGLPANPRSLRRAIQVGQTSFQAAGGPRAYFGDPAAASRDEGMRTVAVLGEILEQAVIEVLGTDPIAKNIV